ncbi:DUF6065 family protein [Falsiroseomonas sp.]|uniref:DUF6065 family protein n=1 Tax=Falsiroseomonas sp. TaxID=2870721 RepID=UPI00356457C9
MNDAPAKPSLIAYDLGGAFPEIRPGDTRRRWMDESPDAFAYRCLPLTIANGHGWEVLADCDVEAFWSGGQRPQDIVMRVNRPGATVPVSHFGAGVLTFHLHTLIRTDPGVSLWVGGPPNAPKDGIAPLTGIVETDWAPMTFTMNWRFTRPNHVIRFEPGEPFCFFFPLPRGPVAAVEPEIRKLAENPALEREHRAWSQGRSDFTSALRTPGSSEQDAKWQKHYHQGRLPGSGERVPHHATKAGARPFRRGGGSS